MAQINQKAVKCLSKLICAGFDTEKAVLTMTMDEILSHTRNYRGRNQSDQWDPKIGKGK